MPLQVPEQPIKTLVPVWLVESDHPALARMARRPVLIAVDELDLTMRGQVVDMSTNHVLLRPEGQFYLCKSVYVEISFRFESTRYTLAGSAQPSAADQSFRMDFDTVARKTVASLNTHLQAAGLMDPDKPGSAMSSVVASAVHEPEEEEEAAPAEQPTRGVRHEDPPDGVERRSYRRYEVETYVRLTLVQEARRMECTMIDLSQSGCRLYFEHPHGLERGLHVEVQFIGDGLPLRLAAIVQACHNPQVVGLRFINVGARMQERIEWLISEIAAGRAIAALGH